MGKKVFDLSHSQARDFLLSGASYFRDDFPDYLDFGVVVAKVESEMGGKSYKDHVHTDKAFRPENLSDVNYKIVSNKDGRLGWRQFELIHPAIYVSLVNLLCEPSNWTLVTDRFKALQGPVVEACGVPVAPAQNESQPSASVRNWWLAYEQQSIELSLDFSHLLQTDVTDCYGSIYTHSISWALHGFHEAKEKRLDKSLLGNKVDEHIRACRHGQTNGIVQGSVLMDLIAELVLAYVDSEIRAALGPVTELKILRYRDDYRIFSRSDQSAEAALKVVSDCLRKVGMRLGVAKTSSSTNVVEAAIKPDKMAGIELRDMDISQAKTIQKQLLRLHSFSRKYPNSGAVKRLAAVFHEKIVKIDKRPDDLIVQIAIVSDIAVVSPQAFPALAGIISHLIALADVQARPQLWERVLAKIKQIPYNGYLEVWLQRVTKVKSVNIEFNSDEAITKIVGGQAVNLWNNQWIASPKLVAALDPSAILVKDPSEMPAVISPQEVALFAEHAEFS